MKRDMDLVRELLLRLERMAVDPPGAMLIIHSGDEDFAVDGKTEAEVTYHLELLRDRGLIDCPGSQPMEGITFRGLTWDGHDFVDSVRDSEVWRETKEGARKAGGFSFEILLALAKGLIKKKIEEHTGVQVSL